MPVTQADRKLMADFVRHYDESDVGLRNARNVLDRNLDDQQPLLDAAAHREAAFLAGVKAGLEAAAKVADEHMQKCHLATGFGQQATAARILRSAIRAIDPGSVKV